MGRTSWSQLGRHEIDFKVKMGTSLLTDSIGLQIPVYAGGIAEDRDRWMALVDPELCSCVSREGVTMAVVRGQPGIKPSQDQDERQGKQCECQRCREEIAPENTPIDPR